MSERLAVPHCFRISGHVPDQTPSIAIVAFSECASCCDPTVRFALDGVMVCNAFNGVFTRTSYDPPQHSDRACRRGMNPVQEDRVGRDLRTVLPICGYAYSVAGNFSAMVS